MLSTRVIGNLLTDNAFLGIAAVGMTFVIISGGIDLSVGSVIAFTGVFLAVADRATTASIRSLAFALVAGDHAPLSAPRMGAIIHYLEMPAFIVTLAGMFLARGMCLRAVDRIRSRSTHRSIDNMLPISSSQLPGGGRLTLIGVLMLWSSLVGASPRASHPLRHQRLCARRRCRRRRR